MLFSNLLTLDTAGQELQSVVFNHFSADLLKELHESFRVVVTRPEQVHIHRRAVRLARPKLEEHRSLQDKFSGVFRDADSVEQSLNAVTDQHELEIIVLLSCEIQEPLSDGRQQVLRLFLAHATASM